MGPLAIVLVHVQYEHECEGTVRVLGYSRGDSKQGVRGRMEGRKEGKLQPGWIGGARSRPYYFVRIRVVSLNLSSCPVLGGGVWWAEESAWGCVLTG